jgi:hypothetical protein
VLASPQTRFRSSSLNERNTPTVWQSKSSNFASNGQTAFDGARQPAQAISHAVIRHSGIALPSLNSRAITTGASDLTKLAQEGSAIDMRRLNSIAAGGLMKMYDPQVGLFCRRLTRRASGLAAEGISPQYTIITLLGLSELQKAGIQSPIQIQQTFRMLLEDTRWVKSIGDIGLLLWLSSQAVPEHLEEVVAMFNVRHALDRAGNCGTIDLALFLAGLSNHALAETGRLSNLSDEAVKTFHQLKQNQGEQGIFGHCARTKSFSGMLRGRIGSFADQSYSIYALAKAAQAFSIESAATTALDCALTMCQLQGPMGQWWWHYDAITGRIVGRYPIFSVHQAGTAPLALMELGKVLNSDFSPWVAKGLQWITGQNELDQDLRDVSTSLIWGYITRDEIRKFLHSSFAVFTRREDLSTRIRLKVNYECRPYHHGMMLYAFGSLGLDDGN